MNSDESETDDENLSKDIRKLKKYIKKYDDDDMYVTCCLLIFRDEVDPDSQPKTKVRNERQRNEPEDPEERYVCHRYDKLKEKYDQPSRIFLFL